MINRRSFYASVRQSLFDGSLSQTQVDGMEVILEQWESRKLPDLRMLAYVLATPYLETGKTMQPISEWGGDAYFTRLYDMSEAPRKAAELGNTQAGDGAKYKGRGFVQITGKNNYRRAGDRYDVDLVNHPDLALEPELAAKILIDGMLEGMFTGRSLGDYINSQQCDFKNARRIVNGTDRAAEIAGYANHFLHALTHERVEQVMPSAPTNPEPTTPKPKQALVTKSKKSVVQRMPFKGKKTITTALVSVVICGAALGGWQFIPGVQLSPETALQTLLTALMFLFTRLGQLGRG